MVYFRTLHDQTDKALHDTQSQLLQLERELAEAHQAIDKLNRELKDQKNQPAETDLDTMKRQLNRIDEEKDELLVSVNILQCAPCIFCFFFTQNIVDSKTEEIASLREDLKCKCGVIEELQRENREMKKNLG